MKIILFQFQWYLLNFSSNYFIETFRTIFVIQVSLDFFFKSSTVNPIKMGKYLLKNESQRKLNNY